MRRNRKNYSDKIVPFIILTILVVAIVSIISIFGGAVMKLFGFEYDSVWSIILFFLMVTLLSFPLDLIVDALPRVLLSLEKITKPMAIVLYLVLDVILSCVSFSIVDYFMESVSATDISIFVLAVVLSLFGIKDISV